MKIARFWEKSEVPAQMSDGTTAFGVAWGWSATSREEALQNARTSAQRVALWLQTKNPRDHDYGCSYPDRVPREEIVREIQDESGEISAIITRNAAGALILSTPRLMFIDVDIPRESPLSTLGRNLGKLFGRAVEEPAERVQRSIAEVAARHQEYSFRLYRTAAGFRCVLLNEEIAPGSERSRILLEEFGADGLYQKLCRSQECYRARLSPKFWRCGAKRPPNRFPWESADEERLFRQWQSEYETQSTPFAVCRFVTQSGTQRGNAELRSLLELHDEMTGVETDFKLA